MSKNNIEQGRIKIEKVWWYPILLSLILLKDKFFQKKYLKEIENFENTPYFVDPSSFVLKDKMTPKDIRTQNMKPFTSKVHLKEIEILEKDFQDLKVSVVNLEKTALKILDEKKTYTIGLLKKAKRLRGER